MIKYVVTKKSSCLNTEKNIVMNVLLKENVKIDSIKNEKITVDELQSRYVRNKNKRKIKFRR